MHRMKIRFATVALVLLLGLAGCGPEEPAVSLDAQGTLSVEEAQLRYWTVGSGAPVILLHGGPGIGSGYLLSELDAPGFPPEGFRWVAYDQRGSGRSTGAEVPENITMERFVEDLEAVRAATGQEFVALMGHSFGGLLALSYALAYPEHVAAMILLDPDPASRELWARHDSIVEARLTDEDRLLMAAFSAAEGWELDPATLENYSLARFQAYFGNRDAAMRLRLGLPQNVYGNFPGTARLMRESLGDWDLFDELEGLHTRTLIITGEHSVFPLQAHERLAEALPRGELVVLPGVGHFPHMEDPAAFAAAANSFLNSVTEDAASGGS